MERARVNIMDALPSLEAPASLVSWLTALVLLGHLVVLVRARGACQRLSAAIAIAQRAPEEPASPGAKRPVAAAPARTTGEQPSATELHPASVARLPLVSDLLASHKAELAQLRAWPELKPLLDPKVHDDLYLLRYLLSAKANVPKAAGNLEKAIVWRRENAVAPNGFTPQDGTAPNVLAVSFGRYMLDPHAW